MQLTEQDNGRTIEIKTGEQLIVVLKENPSTGFLWQVDAVDPAILRAGESGFTPKVTKIGSAGFRRFPFDAISPGAVAIRAKLWRSWEGDASTTERFEIAVTVADPLPSPPI